MLTAKTNGDDSRLSFWPRVREFAVPPSMIETATARRRAGDWAGACAAAGFDVGIDLRSVARTYGRELAAEIRSDLRHLAPDLLRWHLPRVAPDGLLRPGLTITLARYACGTDDFVHLVVRTAPTWADSGQRVALALWDGSGFESPHPHPRPDRRFRMDLHRHLWDARRSDELRLRCGAAPDADRSALDPALLEIVSRDRGYAVDRWAAEARILLDAEGRQENTVLMRLGARHRVIAELGTVGLRIVTTYPAGAVSALPVLPDAATWQPPDLELLRTGAISLERLHPLVAVALAPDCSPSESVRGPTRWERTHLVECGGEQHRIGLVDGVLSALDHDPAEIRREELLAALSGTPLPCLQAIDRAHRQPDCLTGVRERLAHGDTAGALAVVEGLLGPEAVLRDGALRDALEASARQRITYGLYRSGLSESQLVPNYPGARRPRDRRAHPRNATTY
ncbi:hypothetical protein APR12_004644 [Nocardia amikacinitolerans]|uniref:hypothetical protein n=1 Tax=Nocardia amikacinitolerans TaxID=756689 RepID=UPI000835277D|nr:hypothetical protein [Nocardia amikacinitolerans]MCP2319277.1 hypothetical protein [Nocardia amikacinitolerans]